MRDSAKAGAKQSVLIVCTGNSCRSQMAEAIWRHEGRGRYEVLSAGTHPAGVHPLARIVIEELGIEMSGQFSKSVYGLSEREFDIVITVCDDAREVCPVFPHAMRQLHWPFEDPVKCVGTVDERLPYFRKARDEIREKIREFLKAEANGPSTFEAGRS
jgi:arsenate reductase